MNRVTIKKTSKKIITSIIGISIGIGLVYAGNEFANLRIFSERRATKNAKLFAKKNNIIVKRLTCAGDSIDPKYKVRDGYGTCALVTNTGEKIMLQCPADFLDNIMGSKNCKEQFITLNITPSSQTN